MNLGYYFPRLEPLPAQFTAQALTKKYNSITFRCKNQPSLCLYFHFSPTLNKPIYVEVQSYKPLQNFTYQLIARGKVLLAENVAVPNRKYHVFKFIATFEMAPRLHVLVYRFNENKLISAKVDIELKGDLNNYLKLKLSAKQAKPGQNVSIDVLTNPNSYVGLLGVDQSVLLLKQNEGLSQEEAMRAIDNQAGGFYSSNLGTYFYNFPDFVVSSLS